MAVKPIPSGYRTVTPYLMVREGGALIEFLKQAFEAVEIRRTLHPEGRIMNAEIRIGDSVVMVGEATSEFQAMPCSIYLYVEHTDATYERALQAGGISIMKPADQFYGDRNAGVKDPTGNHWWIATHQEDVSSKEMEKRMKDLFSSKEKA
ncbi:MAG: VOC family protein [Oscillatoriales cyanobacterium SM2_2_1]|nr:VOC family protein [Oscillatoriales cyanobacterium SM2_2_1]